VKSVSVFVKRSLSPFTKRECPSPLGVALRLGLSLALGLVLGYLGPYGSYAMPMLDRMILWGVAVPAGHVLTEGSIRLAVHLRPQWGWLPVALAGAPLVSVPLTILIWMISPKFRIQTYLEPLELYFQVLLITVMITLPISWAHALPTEPAPAPPRDPTVPPADAQSSEAAPERDQPFWRRIPGHLGTDLLCLTMEDHYLRIHTPLGSDLILMRMRDAVAELDGLGLQVHRSHWVADSAVQGHERRDGRVILKLRTGLEIPVSKGGLPAVRDAGWLDRQASALPSGG